MPTDPQDPVEQAIETAARKIDAQYLGLASPPYANVYVYAILGALVKEVREPLLYDHQWKCRALEAEAERDHWKITADAHASLILKAQDIAGTTEDVDAMVDRLLSNWMVAAKRAEEAEADRDRWRMACNSKASHDRITALEADLAAARAETALVKDECRMANQRAEAARAERDQMQRQYESACRGVDRNGEKARGYFEEAKVLRSREEALREALEMLVKAADTAPPIHLIEHLSKAIDAARAALAPAAPTSEPPAPPTMAEAFREFIGTLKRMGAGPELIRAAEKAAACEAAPPAAVPPERPRRDFAAPDPPPLCYCPDECTVHPELPGGPREGR